MYPTGLFKCIEDKENIHLKSTVKLVVNLNSLVEALEIKLKMLKFKVT